MRPRRRPTSALGHREQKAADKGKAVSSSGNAVAQLVMPIAEATKSSRAALIATVLQKAPPAVKWRSPGGPLRGGWQIACGQLHGVRFSKRHPAREIDAVGRHARADLAA